MYHYDNNIQNNDIYSYMSQKKIYLVNLINTILITTSVFAFDHECYPHEWKSAANIMGSANLQKV